ncbi:hypothetical protein COU80_04455 [Candidatus Peregrinibacteria bacterium CG10_big_fil_rev_8_21_14_0_10_55_24]|nr:MAG: hypothetical protein COU80_04455 [Candidatus Peregrinibacteria bacterium CG10_big_fil_rev_8_21_14_0_10_55_24]
MSRIRQREIHARRIRQRKLAHLREQYSAAKSSTEKSKIIDRVAKIAPSLTKEAFQAMVKSMSA